MNADVCTQIHQLPATVLSAALPHTRPFDIGYAVRREFVRWTAGSRERYATWQAAWNAWTRAGQARPGQVRLTVPCTNCRGRGIDLRMGRVCHQCMGRRTEHLTAVALWQDPGR